MDDSMWTPDIRRQHSCAGLRYASDLTDAEWRLLAWPLREIVNAIFYVLRAGCAWRLLPVGFSSSRRVCRWFARLRDGGDHRQPEHEDCRGRRAAPLRRRQEGQKPQAPGAGGHRRPGVGAARPLRRCAGPQRRRPGAAGVVPPLILRRARLRGQRLGRAARGQRQPHPHRDRIRPPQGLAPHRDQLRPMHHDLLRRQHSRRHRPLLARAMSPEPSVIERLPT
jgi:transposase